MCLQFLRFAPVLFSCVSLSQLMLLSRTGQMSSNELEFQVHEGRRKQLLVLITSTRTFKQLFLILRPFAFSFEACKWNFFCFYIIKFRIQMFVDETPEKIALSEISRWQFSFQFKFKVLFEQIIRSEKIPADKLCF